MALQLMYHRTQVSQGKKKTFHVSHIMFLTKRIENHGSQKTLNHSHNWLYLFTYLTGEHLGSVEGVWQPCQCRISLLWL